MNQSLTTKPRRALSWLFNFPMFFVLFAALAIAIIVQFEKINFFLLRANRPSLFILSAIPLGYGVLFYLVTRPWFTRARDRDFLIVVLSLAGLLHLLVFIPHQYYPTDDDFLKMHQAAIEMTRVPVGQALAHVDTIFKERAVFYLYPLYLALGPDLHVVRVFNAFLLLASGLFFYLICRKSIGDPRVARLSLVMFFIFPARYIYINIPTHDVAGIFYIALFFLAYIYLVDAFEARRPGRMAAWSLVLALVLAIAAIARTLYLHLLLTVAVMVAWRIIMLIIHKGGRRWLRAGALVLFFLVIPAIAGKMSIAKFGAEQQKVFTNGRFFTSNAAHASGTAVQVQWYERYTKYRSLEDQTLLGMARMCSEPYYNLNSFMQMFVRKLQEGQDTGQELRYYLSNTMGGVNLSWNIATWLYTLIVAVTGVQFVLGMLGLIWLARRPFTMRLQIIPVFAFIFTSLLEITHVQFRYNYTQHFFYALIAGLGARGICDMARARRTGLFLFRPRALWSLGAACAVTLFALYVVPPAVCRMVKNSDYLFVDLSAPAVTVAGSSEDPKKLVVPVTPKENTFYQCNLQLPSDPAGTVKAQWDWRVKPNTNYRLKAFLNSYSKSKGPVNLVLTVDGKEAFRLKGQNVTQFQFIDAGPFATNKDKVTIALEASRAPDAPAKEPIQVSLEYVLMVKDKKQ